MDSRMESTSAISVKGVWLKRFSLDALFGNRTLSSFALPILVEGSSCSRSILNLADRFGMMRLVRKSFEEGKDVARLMIGLLSGIGFLFLLNLFDPNNSPEGASKLSDVSVC